MIATTLSSHRKTNPYGLPRAAPGSRGENFAQHVNREIQELSGNGEAEVHYGDTFIIKTPGSGGFGLIKK